MNLHQDWLLRAELGSDRLRPFCVLQSRLPRVGQGACVKTGIRHCSGCRSSMAACLKDLYWLPPPHPPTPQKRIKMTLTWWNRAKLKWQINTLIYRINILYTTFSFSFFFFFFLRLVHLKINRQSITRPLIEVFTTLLVHRGRMLAPVEHTDGWKDAASEKKILHEHVRKTDALRRYN